MWPFKKSKSKVDTQTAWLNKVDTAYQHAFHVKNVMGLAEYLTRQCLSIMMERVRLGDKAYSGLDRYRHVKWVKITSSTEGTYWRKEVTYDQIKMSHGIVVPVGDELHEQWLVVKEDDIEKVSEIRRIE